MKLRLSTQGKAHTEGCLRRVTGRISGTEAKYYRNQQTVRRKKNLTKGAIEQRGRETSEQKVTGTKKHNKISKRINRKRTIKEKGRQEPTSQNKKTNLTKSTIKQRESLQNKREQEPINNNRKTNLTQSISKQREPSK